MTVHPFGAVWSPSCTKYALQKTANDSEEEYGSAVASKMHSNFYTDNCLHSVSMEVRGTMSQPSMRNDALDLVPEFSLVCHLEFGS